MVQQITPSASPAKPRGGREVVRDPSSPGPTRRKGALLDSLRKESSGWPIANIILILILILSAACMVMYLGSRTGPRLGALKTYWLPGSGVISGLAPCTTLECARERAADDGALASAAAEEAAAEAGAALEVPVTGTVAAAAAASTGSSSVSSTTTSATTSGSTSGTASSTGVVGGGDGAGSTGGSGSASAGKGGAASGLQGALSGLTGFLGLDKAKGTAAAAGPGAAANGSTASAPGAGVLALSVLDVLPLTAEDALKFDFDFWLAEGAKIAGAAASKACSEGYGVPLIERWRKGRVQLCEPGAGRRRRRALLRDVPADGGDGQRNGTAADSAGSVAAPAPARSRIDVFPVKDKRATNMFAAAENTVVDASAFLGGTPGEMPAAPRGSFAAACSVSPERLQALKAEAYLEVENVKRWLGDALQADAYTKVAQACVPPPERAATAGAAARKSGPVLHPVLLLTRWDTTNAFHSLEEVVTTFISLAVLNDERLVDQGLQVVIADGKPDGYYLDVWASLSRPYPLRILSRNPWAPGTCLSRSLHNTFAGTSLLTSMGAALATQCRSPVVAGAALWLRHMLAPAIQPPVRSGFKVPLQNKGVVRKTVVWISRRNFEAQKRDSFTSWQHTRMFGNEGELVLELQREVWRWNDGACMRAGLAQSFPDTGRRLLADRLRQRRAERLRRLQALIEGHDTGARSALPSGEASYLADLLSEDAMEGPDAAGAASAAGAGGRRALLGGGKCRQSSVLFDLRLLELSDVPFYPDQLQVLGNAAIVAGGHGAGLANMMWLPPGKGGVLELHHNSGGNQHYHNLAHMLGHRYAAVDSGGDNVDPSAAARGLRGLMDALGA
ncbi:hypothetical protein CHLRE_16g678997v5 [Chlamydomonas reinhardtii]|uniref:Glycosyltransferase n=1 Tax=Chlamydomonas reinhardtii TaxID=3055 RepID=A0A2K3CVX8_CHLRE|nr:uncharacterized protein CHLRE_16g678997v5 [Chlamydomonas reinhardtii]XP_042916232.1 uncharacterized protein CHLRE_16g678997v5 [Chlamydomonas reinhardtii]PNW72430.1 hypothetical protein CHLRE_16g678997v5 [Chlamydomonas reinhardtii]PNW72431.1 hypothetical protein CHLRE_16g678997v5 [Chlamydomonas reinhardtii]